MYPALQDLAGTFDANEKAASRLVNRYSEEELRWQPDGGKAWSIAQCIDHLASSNSVYLDALLPAIRSANTAAKPVRALKPIAFARLFLRVLEPPVKGKAKAPDKILPGGQTSGAEALRKLQRTHEEVADAIRELGGKNPNRIYFRNPLFRAVRLRAGTALLIMAAHERRHLWQAERVSAALQSRP